MAAFGTQAPPLRLEDASFSNRHAVSANFRIPFFLSFSLSLAFPSHFITSPRRRLVYVSHLLPPLCINPPAPRCTVSDSPMDVSHLGTCMKSERLDVGTNILFRFCATTTTTTKKSLLIARHISYCISVCFFSPPPSKHTAMLLLYIQVQNKMEV